MPQRLSLAAGSVLATLVAASSASAQSSSPPRIGLGISITDGADPVVGSSGAAPLSVITPIILVPITIAEHLRLEPEFGFFRNAYDTGNGALKQSTSSLHVGAGAFATTTPADHFTLYYGARVAYLKNTESLNYNGYEQASNPSVPGYMIAPAVGGEYLLGSRVSLGGEVQVRFISARYAPYVSSTSRVAFSSVSTHGAFVLRFYFR